ncbi:putative DD41D transposase [Trichonephila clavipes]|nr:putative DD41D transposase [Trichonephila clavipes]
MATSTNKAAAFGVKLIHKCMSKHRYIQKKLTVWCALWAGGIIGPYFFKNDEGHNVTVNGDRYRAMITNCFIPELNNHDVQELWFQQDGATCHTARVTIDLLKDTFGDRLISRFGPVNWPPRSCDLTPLDYFLWGYVKSLVYADKPQTQCHKWLSTLIGPRRGAWIRIPEKVWMFIVQLMHGVTLNSLRAASPLVRLVEGKERWEAPDYSEGVLPQN